MKLKRGLLAGIIIAIVIASRLLGYQSGTYWGISTFGVVPPIYDNVVGNTVRGMNIGLTITEQIQLYAGTSPASPIAYTIRGRHVWIGNNTTYPSVYMLDGQQLVRSITNEVMYTMSDNQIFRGPDITGSPVYTIFESQVFDGNSVLGSPLITYIGHQVHWGADELGQTMLTSSSEIQGDPTLEFLMPVLLLERF